VFIFPPSRPKEVRPLSTCLYGGLIIYFLGGGKPRRGYLKRVGGWE
jgi:hypothetical protein